MQIKATFAGITTGPGGVVSLEQTVMEQWRSQCHGVWSGLSE